MALCKEEKFLRANLTCENLVSFSSPQGGLMDPELAEPGKAARTGLLAGASWPAGPEESPAVSQVVGPRLGRFVGDGPELGLSIRYVKT